MLQLSKHLRDFTYLCWNKTNTPDRKEGEMKKLFEDEKELDAFCRLLTRELNSMMKKEGATRIKKKWVVDIVKSYRKG